MILAWVLIGLGVWWVAIVILLADIRSQAFVYIGVLTGAALLIVGVSLMLALPFTIDTTPYESDPRVLLGLALLFPAPALRRMFAIPLYLTGLALIILGVWSVQP